MVRITLAAAAAVALLAVSCSDGDIQAAATTTTSAPTTTAGTPTTTAPATTAPPTTTGTPTTTEAATTATTTLPADGAAVPTNDPELLAALPSAPDVPAGWTDLDTELIDPEPRSGPGFGYCGGKNSAARALDAGAEGTAGVFDLVTADETFVGVTVTAFPTATEAERYMTITRDALESCDSVEYDVPEFIEGVTEGDLWFDGFVDPFQPERAWDVEESISFDPAPGGAGDDVILSWLGTTYTIATDGLKYRDRLQDLTRIEQHDRFVLTFGTISRCCSLGYDWPDDFTEDDLTTPAELLTIADTLRPDILVNVGAAPG
ncbi:MAG: hypothetical protein AAGA90_19610 [Actinomycetota bacterium]